MEGRNWTGIEQTSKEDLLFGDCRCAIKSFNQFFSSGSVCHGHLSSICGSAKMEDESASVQSMSKKNHNAINAPSWLCKIKECHVVVKFRR